MKSVVVKFLMLGNVAALAVACGGDNNGTTVPEPIDSSLVSVTNITVPAHYKFASKFVTDASSVSYSGQTLRQVLMADLTAHIGAYMERIQVDNEIFDEGDVVAELMAFYEDGTNADGGENVGVSTDPETLQSTYSEIGSVNLKDKMAGNDPEGQHKVWAEDFRGWSESGVNTPEELLLSWFEKLDALVKMHSIGEEVTAPGINTDITLSVPYVSDEGLDYQQLIQKFLGGAVAYSQGTDDYLDNDTEGKGLTTGNHGPDEAGSAYTTLEHQWDEGFGYFGAARDYVDYTDEEIAGKGGRDGFKDGHYDTDGDGKIDLKSEINFGHSSNAGKRDFGSDDSAKTDYTQGAWDAFVTGRALLAAVGTTLTTKQMAELVELSTTARENWENAIAATVVHYINDTLGDLQLLADGKANDYSFTDLAKHWSELKGFALSLQFNPVKQISDTQFVELHDLIGDAPVTVSGEKLNNYMNDLLDARDLMGDAYGFDEANLKNW